jgi:hypothetical protein
MINELIMIGMIVVGYLMLNDKKRWVNSFENEAPIQLIEDGVFVYQSRYWRRRGWLKESVLAANPTSFTLLRKVTPHGEEHS